MNQNSQDRELSFKLFVKEIYLYEDLKQVIGEVDKIIKVLYVSDGRTLAERLAAQVPKNLFNLISNLEKNKVLPFAPAELEAYFTSLNTYLAKIPRIILTLAFAPSAEFVAQIGNWLEKNLEMKVVIDVIVKEEIIAGLVIEFNGKYKNYSKASLLGGINLNTLYLLAEHRGLLARG